MKEQSYKAFHNFKFKTYRE